MSTATPEKTSDAEAPTGPTWNRHEMWLVAKRPRWIGALAFALVLAAVFAGLSQWQLARSISTGTVLKQDTETVQPLDSVAKPQDGTTAAAGGQLVRVTGSWVPGEFVMLSDRIDKGRSGYWVVGHFAADTDKGAAGLAVAVGWTADKETAASALQKLQNSSPTGDLTVEGRYYPSEGPQDSDFEKGERSTLSAGEMVNLWKVVDPAGAFGGYVVSADSLANLVTIDSPAPSTEVELNLLNIFYAIEWVVFAGFAIFLWYRLVRDAWEREVDEAAEAAALAEDSARAHVN